MAYHKIQGFQLLECLCGLVIISVLMLWNPSIGTNWMLQWQHHQMTQDLLQALHQAKMLATFENKLIILAPLSGNDWSKGIQLKDSHVRSVWRWNSKRIHVRWTGSQRGNQLLFAPSIHHSMCNGHFELVGKNKSMIIKVNRIGSTIRTQSKEYPE